MPTPPVQYRYTLEMYRHIDGDHLGTVQTKPNFGPAREWAILEAVRSDRNRPVVLDSDTVQIKPRWDTTLGQPYLAGIEAVVSGNGAATAFRIPTTYFHGLAQAESVAFVEGGRLTAGELFSYTVCAYPASGSGREPSSEKVSSYSVTSTSYEVTVDEISLAALFGGLCP